MLCVDDLTTFDLYGTLNSAGYQYLTIEVTKCSNETAVCKSEEEITDFLNSKFLNLNYWSNQQFY